MTEDELLASVMRKIVVSDVYLDILSKAACLDGWVEGLTPDEVQVLRKVKAERP